jgi:translocation and assembly module TamB
MADGRVALPGARVRYEPHNVTVSDVSLDASLSGPAEDPRLNFTLSSGAADMPPLRMEKSVIWGYSGLDTLVIDSARFMFRDSGFIDARARMLYSGMDSLFYNRNFYARCRIVSLPTSLFSRLMPGFRLRNGVLNGIGYVYGDNGRPLLGGALALNGLNIVFPDINPAIGPVDAMLRFADSTVEIASLTARVGRGSIRAEGSTVWNDSGIHGTNLRVNGSNLHFELPEVVNVGVESASLQISDRSGNIVVGGRLSLGPTSYVRDVNFIEMINQMQVGNDIRRAPNPFLETIQLRVDLDLASNMNIDMNLGALMMDGRITVAGTAADPGIMGEIKIRDGYIYYLDRKFIIAEGSIFNPDLTAINPNLKIVARSDVSTYSPTNKAEQFVITLSITGPMESPVVRLTAEPALSELDILSILTFGERLGGMGSDINNRLMNIAAQQAIGIGARRLEKLLNLDRVSVSGDVLGSGGSESAGATIGVTKRITSGLNVTYETNMGKLSDRKVTAQYRILPNLYLEGQTTSGGENALDLIFRFSR